ncbi:chorion peroxidase-like [Bombyx mandarina]|uniref:Chorion peroxidase-like n=1 Tax=Bombyx mandarina TaxID=7092 RepID=A0A6J2JCP8_BOMMA|nr:chorion peroxidase-like [Bombyx mandarina]
MNFKSFILLLINVFLLSVIEDSSCHVYEGSAREASEHIHVQERPCAVCPRGGKCVPKVKCPAHVRPGSLNPSCHLVLGHIGICCFTGQKHSAQLEATQRSGAISIEDIKSSHDVSRQKMVQWIANEKVLERSADTIISSSAPSYGHHLSMVTYDKRVEGLGRGGLLNVFAALELKSRQAVSEDELELGATGHTDGPFCPKPPQCPDTQSRYRSIDGECNNLANPTWGAVNTGFERLLPPDYSDGRYCKDQGQPRGNGQVERIHQIIIAVLSKLSADDPTKWYRRVSVVQRYLIGTYQRSIGMTPFELLFGTKIKDKDDDELKKLIEEEEIQMFKEKRQELREKAKESLLKIQEENIKNYNRKRKEATSYNVGDLVAIKKTQFSQGSKLFPTYLGPYEVLKNKGNDRYVVKKVGNTEGPINTTSSADFMKPWVTSEENYSSGNSSFQFTGDSHGNQFISLTAFHTLWSREHNRVAQALSRLNPHWDEDTVFMETRRILQAEFQHIIYNEWLPLLIGHQMMQLFNLSPSSEYSSSYDPTVNPSITAEFSTAAMRFGHSIVDGRIVIPNTKTGEVYETISIPEVMFQPSRMRLRHFLDRLLIGLTLQPMQSVDPFISEGLTSYMFRGTNPYGLDLASINIQRGKDYGVRSYNSYRRLCGLQPFESFEQFPQSAAKRLASVYESPEDIDLWVGGLLEAPMEEAVIGPTFAHIIADQFYRLKAGDRYFYDNGPDINPGAFTPSQLTEIKKVKLSRLICDNSDGIELVTQPVEAFLRADLPGNELVACNSGRIPFMDLSRFKALKI